MPSNDTNLDIRHLTGCIAKLYSSDFLLYMVLFYKLNLFISSNKFVVSS